VTTNVPVPTFGPTGFVVPAESAILTGVQADINAAFGGNLNFSTTQGSLTNATPQGQLAASMAAIIANANATFLFYSTQTDPAYAEGRFQDAIGRIYFMERIPATPTTLALQCVGAVGTVIPVGSLVVDQSNNQYQSLAAGTIGVTGSTSITFAARIPGLLAIPSTVSIYQAIPGWDTVSILSGVQGQNVESTAAFEDRRELSTAANSLGSLPSILGAVLGVPGVTQAVVLENATAAPVTQNGVTLAANSVYVVAAGGTPSAVGKAIWSRKAPGCGYAAGNTTVTVQDTSAMVPYPSYSVTYQIPNPLPLLFSVQIVNSIQVPATATTLIQQAIINAGNGAPNALNVVDGPQAAIGAKIWASRFVPSISALGTWAEGQVISVTIGSNNNPGAASAYMYCNGTVMTVTSLVSGTISAGQTLSISNGSGTIVPATTIVSQISGTVGGTGVYTISTAQTSLGATNQILQSNTFNTSWTVSGTVTLTGSYSLSPDGTTDAWLWQRGGTINCNINQTINKPPVALVYTFSVYAKPGNGNFLSLHLGDGANSNFVEATFDVSQGIIATVPTATGSTAPVTNFYAVITAATNGFYRCSITAMLNTASSSLLALCGFSNNVLLSTGVDPSSTTNIQIFGAQFEQAAAPSTYVPTTTTAATQVLCGFATANQTFVQVQLNQIPSISANNIAVTFV